MSGIVIFVYAKLFKVEEGAKNYLENTKGMERWSNAKNIKRWSVRQRSAQTEDTNRLTCHRIAQEQLKIDKSSVDRITRYKQAALVGLAGTITLVAGGITCMAMPWYATAGTIAVITGAAFNSIAVIYAAFNLVTHWKDEEKGKKALHSFKDDISELIKVYAPSHRKPSVSSSDSGFRESQKTSDDTFQEIYRQRGNPKRAYSTIEI